MARIKLGEAVTDENGIAVFEYTGTGSGLMDVRAVNGNLQSTTYPVIDATIVDNGTTASHNDNLWHSASQSRISRGTDYSTVKEDTVGTNKVIYSVDSFTAPFCVEMDIYFVDGDNNGFFFVANNGLTELKSFKLADLGYSQSKVGEWLSLKIELNTGSVTITDKNDNTKTATKTYTTAPNRFIISTNGNNSEFRFKNIAVYPI